MKKLIYILICILIGVSLIACSDKKVLTNSSEIEKAPIQNPVQEVDKNEVAASSDETKPSSENKNLEENKKPQAQETKEVKKKKVIVLDPGHANKSNLEKEPLAPGSRELKIKDGGGAAGIITKTPEYKINMSVAMKLRSLLEERNYTVIMTKTENSQSMGNTERAELWNKTNADLVLRIHADSSESSAVRGASMLVPASINENTKAIYEQSKKCGQVVLSTLVSQVGMANRGLVERKDMTGFNWSKVPVILVEMGFLSNKEEDKLLASQEYQDKIAKALAEGISAAVK